MTTPLMEIKQRIRRQYVVTFEEEEAQDLRHLLEGLQESDYEMPFKRMHTQAAQTVRILKVVKDLHQSLERVPAARLEADTQHS